MCLHLLENNDSYFIYGVQWSKSIFFNRYEQTDGTKQEQQGELVNVGLENEHLVVKGRFTFIGDDGITYVVTYIADENGYQPEIEQGPGGAVPDAVVASLLG